MGILLGIGYYAMQQKRPTAADPPAAGPAAPPAIERAPLWTPEALTAAVKMAITPAVSVNAAGVYDVLALAASNTDKAAIKAAAAASGHAYAFDHQQIKRNRTLARSLHDAVKGQLNSWPGHDEAVCTSLVRALLADPLDPEVAGNLGICRARSKRYGEARDLAIYALSLPTARKTAPEGRTADWVTLGAALAGLGEEAKARSALFVALANVDDPVRRCVSAVYSAKNTFGPVLRPATEAMFSRIQDLALTDAPECRLPIAW